MRQHTSRHKEDIIMARTTEGKAE